MLGRKNLGVVSILAAILFAAVLLGCAQQQQASEEQATQPSLQKITIVSGSTGGTTYTSTAAIISAISAAEYNQDLRIINQAGGGSAANLPLLLDGRVDMAAGSIRDAKELWNQGNKNLRAVFIVSRFPGQLIVRADSDIKSWRDLDGKAVSIGSPAFIANDMFREVADILDIKPSKIVELGHRDSMELLVAGDIDGYFFTGFPNPTVQEFCIKYDLRLVPPSPEELEAIKQKSSYLITTIDATGEKIYRGVDVKYDGPTALQVIWATPDLPQETVYNLVKGYWGNKKVAEKLFYQHKEITPEDIFKTKPIPLHAGVVQYYKEMGIEVPEELIPPEYKQ